MTNTLKSLIGWTTVASLAILTACGGGGGGGGITPPTGTNNTIVVTPSPTGVISVPVGQSQPFSATFTTSDGRTATNFSITSGLSTLPAGWTGPTSLTCASVSTGSGCMVTLTYKPTAAGTGSVTFKYSYVNNAGTSETGTAAVSYASTSNNTVIATPSPASPIAVVVGGHTTVGITFKTDDGATATNLSITAGLSGLPAGWSGPKSFTCASVSTGSGCVLNLTYAPSAVASGTLALSYAYKDNSGTAKTGPISIAYSASTQNHVIATTTPAGQIVAVIGGTGQTVKVDFTTDDSNPASNLAVTPANLTSLPAGWTGPATFTCKTVSTGNGCELSLTYLPTLSGGGTVTLNFGYTNNSGVAATGIVTISYLATVDNTVIGTPSPSGTVNVVVGGSKPVTVTFNSNGGSPATNLAITGGLSPLPSYWSGPGTFTCASVTTAGSSCQLSLTYAPTAYVAGGTLQLNYSYKANSGAANTGSVSIPYTATTHNNLAVAQSPSGTVGAVVNSAPVPVTLTFTTDDGNPATAITITSGLSPLPSDWSGPGTFSCPSASTGTGCQLALAYAPTVNGSGTVSLGYSYLDDSGTLKTGTANISYASIPAALYITDTVSSVMRCTMSGTDGSLSSCTSVASGLAAPTGIAFSGKYAYVTPGAVATDVDVCPVNADGSLGACTSAYTASLPNALAVSGGYLFVSDAGGGGNVYGCTINADGSLSACNTNTSYIGAVNTTDGIAVTGANAFIVDINGGNLTTCTNDGDGTLSACTQQTLDGSAPGGGNTPNSTPTSATVYGGNVYMGTHASVMITPISVAVGGTLVSNYACPLASVSGVVGQCVIDDSGPVQTPVAGLVFNNGYTYASGYGSGGGIGICTIEASGIVDKCATSPSLSGSYGGMAVH